MPPAEALKIWQREYTDALASGDKDRIGAATRALELAETEARAPQPFIDPIDQETRALGMEGRRQAEIIRKTEGATKYLFSEYTGGERGPMNAINKTIKTAAESGNREEMAWAAEFGDIIKRYGADNKTGNPYDKANTFNSLAEFAGNMFGMLNALRSLIEKIDDVQVDVIGP
jgi:hypothetical protein